jgi:hypothetical protein
MAGAPTILPNRISGKPYVSASSATPAPSGFDLDFLFLSASPRLCGEYVPPLPASPIPYSRQAASVKIERPIYARRID